MPFKVKSSILNPLSLVSLLLFLPCHECELFPANLHSSLAQVVYQKLCKLKPCLSHQSEDVSWLLSSVINGTQRQAERHTARIISILNGHYSFKSPIVLRDNRQGLDTVKVNLCTFCSNISACFCTEGTTNGKFRNMDSVANGFYSDPLCMQGWAMVTYNMKGTFSNIWGYRGSNTLLHSCRDCSGDVAQIKAICIHFLHFVALLVVEHQNGNVIKSVSHWGCPSVCPTLVQSKTSQ